MQQRIYILEKYSYMFRVTVSFKHCQKCSTSFILFEQKFIEHDVTQFIPCHLAATKISRNTPQLNRGSAEAEDGITDI